jgi:hypothetical protein
LRHGEANRLGGLQIEDRRVFGRRLYRQIGCLLALENAIDIASREPALLGDVGSVGRETTVSDERNSGTGRRPVV